MQDTKAAQEVAALQAFHIMLGQDSARAFYGPGHVRAAHELGAIQTLLISDTLFRVNDVAKVDFVPWTQHLPEELCGDFYCQSDTNILASSLHTVWYLAESHRSSQPSPCIAPE